MMLTAVLSYDMNFSMKHTLDKHLLKVEFKINFLCEMHHCLLFVLVYTIVVLFCLFAFF